MFARDCLKIDSDGAKQKGMWAEEGARIDGRKRGTVS